MDVSIPIVGFIFVCIAMPQLIKNRHQYYLALAIVLVSMILRGVAGIIDKPGFTTFVLSLNILLQAMCIILLVVATGGLTMREFAGNMARAYEVMRRGETEKETIIPLPGQKGHEKTDDEPRQRLVIDAPPPGPPKAPAPKADNNGPIPLE